VPLAAVEEAHGRGFWSAASIAVVVRLLPPAAAILEPPAFTRSTVW
jgi:hypothetical protein